VNFVTFFTQWLPTKAPPSPKEDHVTLGLLLDTDHAFSIVNMGPPADSPEAAEFHSFWGEKSELRRFQDGSINEAVVWEEANQCGVAGKRLVCYRIIQHLLHR
jgi:U3 small nucleolar RNA-associated protein 22